jgi:hypothetical protein
MADKFSLTRRTKDFTLYTHESGPNGWKVAHALEELGLEYESIFLDFYGKAEHKSPGNRFAFGMADRRIYEDQS